jgi:hypothetical protein
MAHAWMNVVYLTDAEYQERVAKQGGKPGLPPTAHVTSTQQQQQ